jgi:hypothetical protein
VASVVVQGKKKFTKTSEGKKKVSSTKKEMKLCGSQKSLLELLMLLHPEWLEMELLHKKTGETGFGFKVTFPEMIGDPSKLNKGGSVNIGWPWSLADGRVNGDLKSLLPFAISIVKEEFKFSTFVRKVLKNEIDVDRIPSFNLFMKSVFKKREEFRRVMTEAGTLPTIPKTPSKKSASSTEVKSSAKKSSAEKKSDESGETESNEGEEGKENRAGEIAHTDTEENFVVHGKKDFLKSCKLAFCNANPKLNSDPMKNSIEWLIENGMIKSVVLDRDALGQWCTDASMPPAAGFLHALMKEKSRESLVFIQNVANEKKRKASIQLDRMFERAKKDIGEETGLDTARKNAVAVGTPGKRKAMDSAVGTIGKRMRADVPVAVNNTSKRKDISKGKTSKGKTNADGKGKTMTPKKRKGKRGALPLPTRKSKRLQKKKENGKKKVSGHAK